MPTPLCPNEQYRQTGSGDAKIIRHGFFRSRCGRRHRYCCIECGRTLSNRFDSAYFRLRCAAMTFDRVAMLSVEGMSRSAIARIEGISWNTADCWVSRASEYAKHFNQQAIKEVELIELQVDELKTLTSSIKNDATVGYLLSPQHAQSPVTSCAVVLDLPRFSGHWS